MPVVVGKRSQERGTFRRWKFHSMAELRKALEEYTALVMGQYLRGERDDGDPDTHQMDTGYRIMAQNAEIDRRMLLLRRSAPLYHRLVDGYYCSGLCCEADGWETAAERAGLPHMSRHHRDVFDDLVGECVRELFVVHEIRL